MKNALRVLVSIGLLWLLGLAIQQLAMPNALLDAVLPPDVLGSTSTAERTIIVRNLQTLYAPSYLSWIGALSVTLLSSYALFKAKY